MTISDTITEIYKQADEYNIDLEDAGIYDDEDLIEWCLRFALSKMDYVFDIAPVCEECLETMSVFDYGGVTAHGCINIKCGKFFEVE